MIDGRGWIADRFGGEKAAAVSQFLDMVVEENGRQNLIAPSTVDDIWQRHALDSAQLLAHDREGERWLDVGTGGGFPGMIVAILRPGPVTLVEPRARRAEFLGRAVADLALGHVEVKATRIEALKDIGAGVISARAVASIDRLLTTAGANASTKTRWVLPRGRTGTEELAALAATWHGVFHVEHSVVDTASAIVILEQVQRR